MKKEYKDLMVNYLNTKENVKIRSFPGGWGGSKFEMDGRELSSSDRVPYLINKGMLEYALINRFLWDKMTYGFTSYELTYNKENQQFEGIIKNSVREGHNVKVNMETPENIWFNDMDVRINVNSKKDVGVDISFNLKNGMLPGNLDEIMNEITQTLKNSILNQIKDIKGRVKGSFRTNVNYFKQYEFLIDVGSIHHEKKDITVPIF
jgi:hypothetical protein